MAAFATEKLVQVFGSAPAQADPRGRDDRLGRAIRTSWAATPARFPARRICGRCSPSRSASGCSSPARPARSTRSAPCTARPRPASPRPKRSPAPASARRPDARCREPRRGAAPATRLSRPTNSFGPRTRRDYRPGSGFEPSRRCNSAGLPRPVPAGDRQPRLTARNKLGVPQPPRRRGRAQGCGPQGFPAHCPGSSQPSCTR